MPFRGELYLPPEFTPRRTEHGRFVKGCEPHNKGKKWSEWMSKRAQKRAAKGWKNLKHHRPSHPEGSGRPKRPIIAVKDDGSWIWLPDATKALTWLGEGRKENINRCCKQNEVKHVNQKTGKVNTDHRYMGIRFYYESDDIWTCKIKDE